jgi:hypothetical protein
LNFDFSNVQENQSNYLTKDYILSNVSSVEIVEYYLNVKLKYSELISSPFRRDKNPSFGIRITNNVVTAKDFSTGETFDCFSIVQKLYSCNFKEALKIIAMDFNISKSNIKPNRQISDLIIGKPPTIDKKSITIVKQPFTSVDIKYWGEYCINIEDLIEYNVFSCSKVFLDTKLIKYYTNTNPIYAYEFKEYDSIYYKIYCPYADKKFKWLFNGTKFIIEGYDQLPLTSTIAVIAKSLKDVIVLNKLGYSAVSLQGEANKLEHETYIKLSKKFENIISFYDNDEAGYIGSKLLQDMYGIEPIYIPDKYKTKDISDFIKKFGYDKSKKLIDKLIINVSKQ